jgi:hypothetical protein
MSRKHRAHTRIAASQAAVQFSVGWYTEQEWVKVRASAADPELFEATYAQWLEMAEQSLAEVRGQGVIAAKSFITADKLLAWCLAHGKPNNSASRAEFVSNQARAHNEPGV